MIALGFVESVFIVARAFDFLAQPQLKLAGRLFGEGYPDNAAQRRAARSDHRDDAIDQFGGFTGAGGGLDDKRGIEVVANAIAHALVGGYHRRAHGWPRSVHNDARRSASLFFDFVPLGARPPALIRRRCSS